MNLFEKIDKIETYKKIIFIFALYIFALIIIYITGGTKYSYTHIIYIPFFLCSVLFKMLGGILGSLISAVTLALMPVNTCTLEMQSFSNWFTRLIIFLSFGYISGFISKQAHQEYHRAKKSSYHNELGIPNGNAFKMEINRCIEQKKDFSIVIIYIENKFEIDNTIGHSKSSLSLRTITQFFQRYITCDEINFFFSDNNYKFLLKNFSYESTLEWIKIINSDISTQPVNIEDFIIFLKTMIGSAVFDKNTINSDEVIKNAFIAMDYSRNNYKDFYIYNSDIEETFDYTTLVSEFKQGLDRNDLYIEYQPKLNLINNKVYGIEALIRWKHKKYGMIPPSNFIPKLEKTNYINDLTYWILENVLEDIKDWEKLGLHLKVSVNITPRNIEDEKFSEKLLKFVNENKPHSQNIEFEMTETDLMKNLESHNILDRFKKDGIIFAIDDFGTGYSSLAYFKEIPADYIKIDRTFIKEILSNDYDKEIVTTTIKLAHTFGKSVIAEGVEDLETLEFLKQIDCDEIQGYFYAKPMVKSTLTEFLKI